MFPGQKLTILYFILIVVGLGYQASGQFSQQKLISKSTSSPSSVKSYDLDNDGDLDVLCTSKNDNKVSWYENLGNGLFSSQKTISLNAGSCSSAKAYDLDGDGDLEVIVASPADGKLSFFENFGSGVFSIETIVSDSLDGVSDISIADFNGDGKPDIAACSPIIRKILWFENNGNRNFGPGVLLIPSTPGQRRYYTLNSADIDADGDMDLMASGENNDGAIFYNNNGALGSYSILNPGSVTIQANDVDLDADLDLIHASRLKIVLTKYDSIGLSSSVVIESLPNTGSLVSICSLDFADVDGDGLQDIVVCFSAFLANNQGISWYRNLGGGQFGSKQSIIAGMERPVAVTCGDLNNDGLDDVIFISDQDDKLAWHENLGNANIGPEKLINTNANRPNSIFSADLDGDLKNDILYASHWEDKIAWHKNLGGGIFSDEMLIFDLVHPSHVYAADLDGDSLKDIIATNYDDIVWCKNLGASNFGPPTIITSLGGRSVNAEDYDNDGDIDITASIGFYIYLFENLGNGVFSAGTKVGSGASLSNVSSIVSDDIDDDGYIDICFASSGNDKIGCYKNIGTGSFGSAIIVSNSALGASSVALADLNEDDKLDLISASSFDNKVVWYPNVSGTFNINNGEKVIYQTTLGANVAGVSVVGVTDINGDGLEDIVYAAEGSDYISWRENLIGETFGPEEIISNDVQAPKALYFSDLDGDGDNDVISGSEEDDKLAWYENYYPGPFRIAGRVFYDHNQNGIKDGNDYWLKGKTIEISPISKFCFTNSSGFYSYAVDTLIQYFVQSKPSSLWNLTSGINGYYCKLSADTPVVNDLDFGYFPDTLIQKIKPVLVSEFPSCSTTINYWSSIENVGTTISNAYVQLGLDDRLSFVNASVVPDSVIGQNVYWNYNSLKPSQSNDFFITASLPSNVNLGDTLISSLICREKSNPNLSIVDTLKQILSCSQNPNDKIVLPKGEGPYGLMAKNQTLEYTVRFQNVGSATSNNVIIRDQLDDNLDWSTFKPVSASHSFISKIGDSGELTVYFNGIMLPDSGSNAIQSHGFFNYKIDVKPNLPAFTPIFNKARIYFDQNPVIFTNTTINTIDSTANISLPELMVSEQSNEVMIFPNPTQGELILYHKWKLKKAYDIRIYNMSGLLVYEKLGLRDQKQSIAIHALPKGIYILQGGDENAKVIFKTKIIKN